MKKENVWLYPENEITPVLAGTIEEGDIRNIFEYDRDFLNSSWVYALDPIGLPPIKGKPFAFSHNDRGGIPAIVTDSGPDSWGKRILNDLMGETLPPLDTLVCAPNDGVGNLVVGDIDKKSPIRNLDMEMLVRALEGQRENLPTYIDDFVSPETALGGAKPKATLVNENGFFIAKYQHKEDDRLLPFYECAALTMASRLGIPAAQSTVEHLPNDRFLILVRRFDRKCMGDPSNIQEYSRLGFASFLTLFGKPHPLVSTKRDYVVAADKLKGWVPREDYPKLRREIWERVVLNSLMGNNDDHPGNHGLLRKNGTWGLAPVYDICPVTRPFQKLFLKMHFSTARGEKIQSVSVPKLIEAAPTFGWEVEEARLRLASMSETISNEWMTILDAINTPTQGRETMQNILAWNDQMQKELREMPHLETSKPTI